MKEIKFRGKRKDNNKWVYGYYVYNKISGNHFVVNFEKETIKINAKRIIEVLMGEHEVKPETVGQYIGLKDKNDKEIYKGDILKVFIKKNYSIFGYSIFEYCKVYYNENEAKFDTKDRSIYSSLETGNSKNITVIGNIYENPELLKK